MTSRVLICNETPKSLISSLSLIGQMEKLLIFTNPLLTEREGRTEEYWPQNARIYLECFYFSIARNRRDVSFYWSLTFHEALTTGRGGDEEGYIKIRR